MSSSELPPVPPEGEGTHVSMPGGPTNLGRDVLPEDIKAYRAFIGPFTTRLETAVASSGLAAFTEDFKIPSSLLEDRPALPGQTAVPEVEMQRRQADAQTYQAIKALFPDTVSWHRLLRGDYPTLMRAANSLAHNLAEDFKGEWTLPRAFGVHALVSVWGFGFRPKEGSEPSSPVNEDRMTYFLSQFAKKWALQVPETDLMDGPNPQKLAKNLGKRSVLLAQLAGTHDAWLSAKLTTLGDNLGARTHTLQRINQEPAIEIDNAPELAQYNDELFAELKRLRRYSIKPALHEGEETGWSIHDMQHLRLKQREVVKEKGGLVHVDEWSPMIMSAVEHPLGLTNIFELEFEESKDIGFVDMSELGRMVYMDGNGELFIDIDGAMPLADLYKQAGKPTNYEVLRQFLLQKLFDLTVPLEVIREADEEGRAMRGVGGQEPEVEPGRIYYDLLLPRIRVLRRYRHARDLDEIEAYEVTPYPFHRVGGRVNLPKGKGYKASDRARQLAAAAGIELREGETYRSPYNPDPAIARSATHKAKGRPPKKTAKQQDPNPGENHA